MHKRPLAELKWSPIQRAIFIGILVGSTVLAVIDIEIFLWSFSILLLGLYGVIVLCKILAALCGLLSRFTIHISEDAYNAIDEQTLPIYTILLPLYKESEVVEKLVAHIGQLDYPKEKLDVKVLLEENDEETLNAITAFGLPDWCELIIVPDEGPKTKPRACNVGLQRARGEYCVIYDAEDQPEPDQLKKVICAYQNIPESVVCLQAKLNFFNDKEGWLPRCFALEYTTWFDLYLPGLHALHAPIPLGGTSNHFKTSALKQLDGWDPYNVTEDCDLGIRIAEAGYSTRIIDSVTWEEAPCHVSDWVGQRSRWIKGYFQTFWVHTRNPWQRLRKLGLWGFFQMLITVGGQVACVILNPICWLVLACWLYWQWPIIYVHSPYTLTLFTISLALFQFNALFIGIHLIAAMRRRRYKLIPAVLLLPFYWVLVSVGAWRGVLEFFWSPYKWVKTTHGLTSVQSTVTEVKQFDIHEQEQAPRVFVHPISQHGLLHKTCMGLSIAGLSSLIAISSIFAPVYFGYSAKVEQARIELTDNFFETEQLIDKEDASWLDYTHVKIDLQIQNKDLNKPISMQDIRLMFYMKVRDGEWFHQTRDEFTVEGDHISMELPITQEWQSNIPDFPWSSDLLRRVRSFGVKTYHNNDNISAVHIVNLTPITKEAGQQHLINPQILELQAQPSTKAYQVTEARWQLNKNYSNPFDSDVISCDAIYTHESGTSITIPAFYTQDYYQHLSGSGEQLLPRGAPYWCARFSPQLSGAYTWHIEGQDYQGYTFRSPEQKLMVAPNKHRGFLKLGKKPRYFAFENGDFFYPVSINIRSPRDEINHDYFTFDMPKKEKGTYVMYEFIEKMETAGINVGRIWMSPWFGGLEWNRDAPGYHGLGVYNLKNAHRLDSIFKFAAQRNIMIELALNHHGPFTEQYDSQWKDNPYNTKNGGPAMSPRHVLPNKRSRSYFKKRLRYIAARYGAYPNLFCYILWIEANVVDPRPHVLVDWHKEFGPYMKNIDGHRHLVSTEFNNNGYAPIWRQKEIEYTQVGAYNFGKGTINEFIEISNLLKPYAKPAVLEEYMGLPSGGHEDVLAHEFHDGLWANWMLPLGAAPMPWWWNFIFEKNLQVQYQVFNAFIQDENLPKRQWKFLRTFLRGQRDIRALARLASDRAFIWIYKDQVSNIRFRGRYEQRREAAHKAYRSVVPDSFKPVDQILGTADAGFMNITKAELVLPAGYLKPGKYELEIWDTWQLKDPQVQTIHISEFPHTLTLPQLQRDIALKLKAIE